MVILVVSCSDIFSISILFPSKKVLVHIHKMCKYETALYIKYQLCVNMMHFLDLVLFCK